MSTHFILGQDCTSISNPNEELLAGSKDGNITAVEFILGHCNGIDINKAERSYSDYTPLIWASQNGHSDVVQVLLQNEDIDVNIADRDGITALYKASSRGHKEVVQLLLQKEDIDVNIADYGGSTALHMASRNGRAEVVQLLLHKEDIDVNDEWLIYWLSRNGFAEALQLLLQKEVVGINKADRDGKTALYWATYNGHAEVVQLLLQREDIDVNRESNTGETAYFLAAKNKEEKGQAGIVQMFWSTHIQMLQKDLTDMMISWK